MARYRTLGTGFDDTYRNDLNTNFTNLSNDVDTLFLPVGDTRLSDGAVTPAKASSALTNRVAKGLYQVTGGLKRVKYNSDNSVTVSFDTLTIFKGNPGGGATGVVNVTAMDNVTIPSLSALYIDMSGTAPLTAQVTTGTYYSATTYGNMGFVDDTKVILLGNYFGRLHGFLAPKLKTNYDNRTMVLTSDGAGSVDIYAKGTQPDSFNYVKYPMRHLVQALDTSVAASNYDIWRLSEMYEVERTGDYTFNQIKQICNSGEIELAVRGTGWGDNVGGSNHGDEILTSAALLVDGVKTSLTDVKNLYCKNVRFIVKSDLYKDNQFTAGALQKFATHLKVYEFTSEGLKLYQEVAFLESFQLMNAYLTMLPIRRLENGATGQQITNEAMRDYDYVTYGVSTAGFDNDLLTKRKGVKNAHIWGTSSGISAHVEILDRAAWLNGEGNSFKNDDAYNKIYFDYCGSYTPAVGEVFKQTSMIRVNTRN